MTPAEKDAIDQFSRIALPELELEIQESNKYIRTHSGRLRKLSDRRFFIAEVERQKLLSAIYDLRTSKISQKEFDSLYEL